MTARRVPLALCTVALVAGLTHAALTTDVPAACHSVDVSEESGITADYLAILHSEGYTGDPRDGAERLYAPDCPNARSAAAIIRNHAR